MNSTPFSVCFLIMSMMVCVTICAKKQVIHVRQDRLSLWMDEKAGKLTGGMRFFNRTSKVVDVRLIFFRKLEDNAWAELWVYKWINQNYVKYAPIQLARGIKDILESPRFGLQRLYSEYCSPPLHWPFNINKTYSIKNFTMYATTIPFVIPGKYRLDVYLKDKPESNIILAQLHVIVESVLV